MSPPIFSILLPTTRTDVLAVSLSDLPSNTFTFLNRVAFGCFASIVVENPGGNQRMERAEVPTVALAVDLFEIACDVTSLAERSAMET